MLLLAPAARKALTESVGEEAGRGNKRGGGQVPSVRRGMSRRVHWSGRTHASRAIENSTHWARTAEPVQAIANPRTVCREPFGYSRSTQSAGAGETDSVMGPVGASSWSGGTNTCVVGGSPCQPAALATRGYPGGGVRRRLVHATTLRGSRSAGCR